MKYCCIVHTVLTYYAYLMIGGKEPLKDLKCPKCKKRGNKKDIFTVR